MMKNSSRCIISLGEAMKPFRIVWGIMNRREMLVLIASGSAGESMEKW